MLPQPYASPLFSTCPPGAPLHPACGCKWVEMLAMKKEGGEPRPEAGPVLTKGSGPRQGLWSTVGMPFPLTGWWAVFLGSPFLASWGESSTAF